MFNMSKQYFWKGDEIVVKSSGKFRMRWHAIPREKLVIP